MTVGDQSTGSRENFLKRASLVGSLGLHEYTTIHILNVGH
jgi:hypothetical protein